MDASTVNLHVAKVEKYCRFCKKIFANVQNLKKHMKKVHNSIKHTLVKTLSMHAVINRLERNLTMTINKSTRYWQVLREYENNIYNGVM